VVEDAIRFTSQQSKRNTKSSYNDNEHVKESNEPDYDEDKDQLEEKQQEQETGEMTLNATANQVF